MFCSSCGKQTSDTSAFCGSCGRPVVGYSVGHARVCGRGGGWWKRCPGDSGTGGHDRLRRILAEIRGRCHRRSGAWDSNRDSDIHVDREHASDDYARRPIESAGSAGGDGVRGRPRSASFPPRRLGPGRRLALLGFDGKLDLAGDTGEESARAVRDRSLGKPPQFRTSERALLRWTRNLVCSFDWRVIFSGGLYRGGIYGAQAGSARYDRRLPGAAKQLSKASRFPRKRPK